MRRLQNNLCSLISQNELRILIFAAVRAGYLPWSKVEIDLLGINSSAMHFLRRLNLISILISF